MKNYPTVIRARIHGNPKPRIGSDGYTKSGGSPTRYQVLLEGETVWRRVWIWQTSNLGTNFIKSGGKEFIININGIKVEPGNE